MTGYEVIQLYIVAMAFGAITGAIYAALMYMTGVDF